ncbi:helix-turn-helix domain-containing protein [Brachybacterium alimentarium]|uniref:helix-turn-helix domain-containing protein n=1 Tax=Brachybacterium alimentarium TaxID=47845 RepID=UPI003FCF0637
MSTWLSTETVADQLGRNIDTIRRYCREGKFPGATRQWGDWKIPAVALDPDTTPRPLIAPPSRRSRAQQRRTR